MGAHLCASDKNLGITMNKLSSFSQWLSQRPYIIAILISVTLIFWMASGVSKEPINPDAKEGNKSVIPKVKVQTLRASSVQNNIELYGRTEPQRVTTLKAEIYGQVVKVHAKRGSFVKKGQIIAELALNDLDAQLTKSKALLVQREIEYKGAKKLNASGYQGEVQLSQSKANLAAIKAEIKRLEIAIDNTVIRAPFDGVLNTRYVEQGDYVQAGDDIALIADLNPLIVRAFATENQVGKLSVGQKASVKLLDKGVIEGHIRYISSVADDATNTFKIEVKLDNSSHELLAGISSEISIGLKEVNAIKISPALLALDEHGNIGVKTVKEDLVVFTPINLVKSESDGLWLTGLGQQADVIVLGQGFVRAGDKVEAIN